MQLDLTPTLSTPYTIIPVPSNLIPSSPSPPKQHILWVGCSDSLVSETDSLDVDRQEIFVHRNLGNLLSNADLSSQSSIEWAVELLKVCPFPSILSILFREERTKG
jgi:carbonic anhydrase